MAKSYQQLCGVAVALDVVGDRWSLLLVREMLSGPKRFSELEAAMQRPGGGVATDRLAARLRELQGDGVVEKVPLPPAARRGRSQHAYALTARGVALEPVLLALARWGIEGLQPAAAASLSVTADWLALALRALFRPGAADAPPLVIRFDVDEHVLSALVVDGALSAVEVGERAFEHDADVRVSASVQALLSLLRGVGADVTVDGEPADVARAFAHFAPRRDADEAQAMS